MRTTLRERLFTRDVLREVDTGKGFGGFSDIFSMYINTQKTAGLAFAGSAENERQTNCLPDYHFGA